MALDLITIGDAFFDIFVGPVEPVFLKGKIRARLGSKYFDTHNAQILAGKVFARRTNLASAVETDGGGSAANVALAGAKLGMKCGVIIRLGDDEHGRFCVQELERSGVDVSQVKFDTEVKTGISINFLKDDGDRACVTYLGSNRELSLKDISLKYITRTKIVHICNCYFLPKILGKPMHSIIKEIKRLNKNILISIDPGPVPIHFSNQQVNSITSGIKLADIFFPSLDEARVITGVNSPKMVLKKLLILGPKIVVMKMGAKGCLLANNKGMRIIPPFKIDDGFIDTAGAGDVFAAALILGLTKGLSTEEATALANVAAGIKVLKKGRKGYPTWQEVKSSCDELKIVSDNLET